MTIEHKIIDFIRRNRISTCEISDCLGKAYALEGIQPLNKGHFAIGKILWVYAYDESNWSLHEQIQQAPEGQIVLVDTFNCGGRASLGALTAKFLLLYRQCSGIVVRGPVRDAAYLRRENWPIWSDGVTPLGCFNERPSEALDETIEKKYRAMYDGAIAVCDDSGAIYIPVHLQNEKLLRELQAIEDLEDIWFDCIDRRKWNTFETVCLQKYLEGKNE